MKKVVDEARGPRALTDEQLLERVLDTRGLEIPREVLLEIGEVRRFRPRLIRKGPFAGTELPGFVGRIVDVKPWRHSWCYVVDVKNQGFRFAPRHELEVLRRKGKKQVVTPPSGEEPPPATLLARLLSR
jgi:hypothetical protein